MPHSELMTRVSQMWGELPADKKEVYEKLHAVAKTQYETKKQQYEDTKNSPVIAPVPAIVEHVDAESDAESDTPFSSEKKEESDGELSEEDDEDEVVVQPPKKKSKPDSAVRKSAVTPSKDKKSKKA